MGEEKKQKQSEENIINSIKNLFILKKEKKEIKDRITKNRIIRDIGKLFEGEDDGYDKRKRVSIFWNNNYIEYESNGYKKKSLITRRILRQN